MKSNLLHKYRYNLIFRLTILNNGILRNRATAIKNDIKRISVISINMILYFNSKYLIS